MAAPAPIEFAPTKSDVIELEQYYFKRNSQKVVILLLVLKLSYLNRREQAHRPIFPKHELGR